MPRYLRLGHAVVCSLERERCLIAIYPGRTRPTLSRHKSQPNVNSNLSRGNPAEDDSNVGLFVLTIAIVGLPDKAVSEARERVRSALIASGLALPARRIIVNLAPAALPKEGSHYDLPIALGLMAANGATPPA